MDISVRKRSDVQVIQLRGDLRLGEPVNGFNQAAQELMQAGEYRFVINLAEVPKIDSSGIGSLVKLFTTAKASGGDVKLVGPSEFTAKTLRLVGVARLFETYEDEQTAIGSFTLPAEKRGEQPRRSDEG